MVRIVFVALAVAAVLCLVIQLAREIGKRDVDWRGVAMAAGFVALAFYLRHVTDIGGIG